MGKAIAGALKENDRKVKVFAVDLGYPSRKTAEKYIKGSDFIILAVKPYDASEALRKIKNHIKQNTIIISIMAGMSIKKLVRLSAHKKIIRIMPNLGLSVGEGIAVWKAAGLSKMELKKVKLFIGKITDNFEVKNEDMINKVTAVSGSGPAYFFTLAESMLRAAIKLGLKKNEGRKLVEKTFSAAEALAKNADYSTLVKKVASKGGTTEAALKVFNKEKFAKTVERAVNSAYKRAKEINNE